MKKILALALAVLLVLPLAACGGESEKTRESPSPSEAAASFSAGDLALTSGGASYKCDVEIGEIISVFGEDYAYSEAISCAYDGLDKVYGYESAGVDFSTRPDGEKDIVCEIYAYSGDWATAKGIKLGSTREEVIAAYGEPTQSTNFIFYYILPASNAESEGASLYFEFASGDAVSALAITAEQLIGEE